MSALLALITPPRFMRLISHRGFTRASWVRLILIILFFVPLLIPAKVYSSEVSRSEGISTQIVSKDHDYEPSPDYSILKVSMEVKSQEYIPPPKPVVPAPVVPPQPTYTPLGTNFYKNFIYDHESGNNPSRWNGGGCLGLGQACPASKLLVVCPTMDYGCEDQWFTNYMQGSYGSWEAAYAWWIRTDCRKHGGPTCYSGHWW